MVSASDHLTAAVDRRDDRRTALLAVAGPPTTALATAVSLVAFAAVFVALGFASSLVEPKSLQSLSCAAPTGLACAIAAVVPRRSWPLLGTAIFVSTLLLRATTPGLPFDQTVGTAVANTFEAFLFAWLVTEVWPTARRLSGRPDVALFFAASAITAAIGGVLATAPYHWSGPLYEAWAVRFTGHWLGIMGVAPAVLLLGMLRRLSVARWLELALFAGILVATTEIGFDSGFTSVVFPYVPLAVMLVMVVRQQTPGAVVLPWALAPVALWQTNLGHGPFAELAGSSFDRILAVQLYGLTGVLCSWLIAAVLGERAAAMDALEQVNASLEDRVVERTAQLATATRWAQVGATVSQALAEAGLDLNVTMGDIARHLGDILDATCVIATAGNDDPVFVPCVAYSTDKSLQDATWRAFSRLRFDARSEGLTGRAVATRRTVRAHGRPEELAKQADPRLRSLVVELGIRDAAVVLMHHRGDIVGTITMLRTTDRPFDDTEAQLLEDLAARAGLAIANARLYAEIAASEERFHAAFDDGPMGMALVDLTPARTGLIIKANDALSKLTGYASHDLAGQSLSMLFPRSSVRDDVPLLDDVVVGDFRPRRAREFPLVRADRSRVWVRYSQSIVWHGSRPSYAVALLEDITSMKRAEGELRRRALFDPLTGLANRHLLADHLDLALEQIKRVQGTVAVLYIDLDRFKDVNDGLGHEVGDQVLREVGARLSNSVRAPDTAARLGGDEFVVVCPGITDDVDATGIAERLEGVLAAPHEIGGACVDVGASIGIATTHSGTVGADELLRQADLAMYEAKQLGRRRWAVYDKDVENRSKQRHDIEQDLRRAIEEHWLVLHYQPVIDLRSELIVGVEALLRIDHPDRGLVTPDVFIEVAEESDLILPIGEWVLQETCSQLARWERFGRLEAAINVSGRQVVTHNVTNAVLAAAAANGIEPANLTIEMTERVLIDAAERTLHDLERLTDHGVRLAIDDFGTGYSSLTYLNRFPVDTVKIDRSFIAGLGIRDRDTAIVEAITGLARTLDITAVAEGVETAEQLEALRELGCDRAQGYHLGRPMPAADVTRLLEAQR